jgi:hypothetical protein
MFVVRKLVIIVISFQLTIAIFVATSWQKQCAFTKVSVGPVVASSSVHNYSSPDIVVIIPTAMRMGESDITGESETLIQTLDSLLTALNDPRPFTLKGTGNMKEKNNQSIEIPKLLILVINMMLPDEHTVFSSVFKVDRYKDHPSIRFLQISSKSTPVFRNFTGASVPVMDGFVEHKYIFPVFGGLTVFERMFENPSFFLNGWSKWDKEIFTKDLHRKQTADYLSALHYSISLFPNSDIMLWEDDCRFCPNVFPMVRLFQATIARKNPHYGVLRVGYGGSGLLINHKHVPTLIPFAYGTSFVSNVDIAIHKYFSFLRIPCYVTSSVYSLHRGTKSIFAHRHSPELLGMSCSAPLRVQWGRYAACTDPDWEQLGIACTAGFDFR